MADVLEDTRLDESLLGEDPKCQCTRAVTHERCQVEAAYVSVCRACNGQHGFLCAGHAEELVNRVNAVYSCSFCGSDGLFRDIARLVAL